MGNVYVPTRKELHYTRSTPIFIPQGDTHLCWAASLQSWLDVTVREFGEKSDTWSGPEAEKNYFSGLPWKRERLELKDMINRWGDLLNDDKSLVPENMPKIALDIGMTGSVLRAPQLVPQTLFDKIRSSCLYVIYFSVMMNHAIVVYGYTTPGTLDVMDPNPQLGPTTRPLSFFSEPNRAGRAMFVGWAV